MTEILTNRFILNPLTQHLMQRMNREEQPQTAAREATLQKQIMNYLSNEGWLVLRINSTALQSGNNYVRSYTVWGLNGGNKGVSDIIAFKNGQHLFIEVKTARGRVSPHQKRFAHYAQAHGEQVHVVRSIDEVVALLQQQQQQQQ